MTQVNRRLSQAGCSICGFSWYSVLGNQVTLAVKGKPEGNCLWTYNTVLFYGHIINRSFHRQAQSICGQPVLNIDLIFKVTEFGTIKNGVFDLQKLPFFNNTDDF